MEKKLCIGIDASRANKIEKTGVEWYAFYLIREFKKLIPPEYRVILYSAEPLMSELANLPPNWESKIIKGVNLGRGPWLWTQLGLTLEMIKNTPDVLFVPSHAIPLIHPKHTFTTIHDIGFEVFPESYGFLARLYHRFSARLALRRAEKIFTPSEFTKQELIKYYHANPEKIIVTPLGFDPTIYHPRTKEEIPPLKIRGGRGSYEIIREPYILFIGRIEKKKNDQRLIQAFLELKKDLASLSFLKGVPAAAAGEGFFPPLNVRGGEEGLQINPVNPSPPEVGEGRVRGNICGNPLEICENPIQNNNSTIQQFNNLKLLIVGSKGFGYEEIRATAEKSTFKDDVIFTGYMPTADLPRILAGAFVYALPSLYEGFGIPILEAMASGVPVLTSNAASMPEVCCQTSPFGKGSTRPESGEGFKAPRPPEVSPVSPEVGSPQVNICENPLEICENPKKENPLSICENPKNCAACLVNPLSVESIKSGLKKILTDQAYHDDLVARGLNRVKDFTWEKTAKTTIGSIVSDIAPAHRLL